jgi:hypothetical protein
MKAILVLGLILSSSAYEASAWEYHQEVAAKLWCGSSLVAWPSFLFVIIASVTSVGRSVGLLFAA